ncbi:hypothetical protein BFW01_g9388 [Lasiodiplodia theobromae]|uniref:Uncharacterized protein n=1 Tax=Lasiodiplodia theobromae TaxID=45133 RepID=A0A5N5DJ90_9PEZI|nr:Ring finger domain protein [Lasiodiplodia theobromae]KAB2577966.1 hypothetical protein DBV05_g3426 [Lasiodiplodia theobromae]KAF4538034.1 Ring finger domain protein [Lasiodiplodia theobromae]KAF9638491.1 hypothetical protein BFW01_g9388 [Lasiodiplodia theobromae]
MPVVLEPQKLLTWFPRDESQSYTPADIPMAGRIMSMILSLVTLCVLSICICRRVQGIHRWSTVPLGAWYILLIYVDSFLFVFITAVFKDVGLNETVTICRGAILLCLTLYLSTKVCVYLFLVEKAYIVRGCNEPRHRDKLYMFNICAAMGPYAVLAVLNIIWRFSHIEDGTCIIGMQKKAMMPLIIFDAAVNVYLTTLFIVPLRQLYSYKSQHNTTLHTMAVRTFFGSCATLTSSIANLTLLMVLDGEPAWICFLSCNAEILFSVLTLHWVTSRDKTGQTTNRSYSRSGEPSNGNGSSSNQLSLNKSRNRNNAPIGTETLISEHYQDRAAANKPGANVSVWGEDDELTTRMLDDAYQGRGAGGSPWPEDTRAVVSASCGRADENDLIASSSTGAGADSIALGRIVVTKQSEIRALTREEERREQEERERRRRKGGVAGRNSRHGSRTVTGGVVMTTTTTMTTNDAESDTSRTTAEGSRREGSTDGIILAPGPAHMV